MQLDTKATNSLRTTDLFIFSGESSGDSIGAELLASLLSLNPSLKISAVAGPKMREYPITTLLPMEEFQVMGFIDVLKSFLKLSKLFRFIKNTLLKNPPTTIVFIDYPGFNLRMASHLRRAGFKGSLIHYVCPSVWAWKKGRVMPMARDLNLLISIFPFEKECFTHTNLQVEYIGHPLVSKIESYQPNKESPDLQSPIFSIFPGSRKKEIERNFSLQLKAAAELTDKSYTIAVSYADESFLPLLEEEIKKYPFKKIKLFPSKYNYDIMRKTHIAFATSGTITLELALYQVPTLVTYFITKGDFFLAKHIFHIKLPHYCITNYTVNKRIFPEFYGPDFTQDNLYATLTFMLNNPDTLARCKEQCSLVKEALTMPSPSLAAARHILKKTPTS
jgi:lipid-A-disaccharide synthase